MKFVKFYNFIISPVSDSPYANESKEGYQVFSMIFLSEDWEEIGVERVTLIKEIIIIIVFRKFFRIPMGYFIHNIYLFLFICYLSSSLII